MLVRQHATRSVETKAKAARQSSYLISRIAACVCGQHRPGPVLRRLASMQESERLRSITPETFQPQRYNPTLVSTGGIAVSGKTLTLTSRAEPLPFATCCEAVSGGAGARAERSKVLETCIATPFDCPTTDPRQEAQDNHENRRRFLLSHTTHFEVHDSCMTHRRKHPGICFGQRDFGDFHDGAQHTTCPASYNRRRSC